MRLQGESFQAPLPSRCLGVLTAFLPNTPIKKKSIIKCEKTLNMYWRRSTSLLSHCTPLTHYYLLALLFFSSFLLIFFVFFTLSSKFSALYSLPSPWPMHPILQLTDAGSVLQRGPHCSPRPASMARCGRGFIWWWGDTRRLSSCSQVCLRLFLFASLSPRLISHPAPP